MKKIVFVFVITVIVALSQFSTASASDVRLLCSLTGKITNITNDYVYFAVNGKSLQGLLSEGLSTEKCLLYKYYVTYKFPRPLRTIFMKDQKIFVELSSITAMGPDGVAPSSEEWNIKSEIDVIRPFSITIQPEKVDSGGLAGGKIYSVAEKAPLLTPKDNQTYTIKQLKGAMSTSTITVKVMGFVSKIDWCDPRSDTICPQNLFIVENMNDDWAKNSIIIPFGFYEYNKFKPLKVRQLYEFTLSSSHSDVLNQYSLVSARIIMSGIATSTTNKNLPPKINTNNGIGTTSTLSVKSFTDGSPYGGDVVYPEKKFVWWNPFTWFGY